MREVVLYHPLYHSNKFLLVNNQCSAISMAAISSSVNCILNDLLYMYDVFLKA
jgi:hypothetical protein